MTTPKILCLLLVALLTLSGCASMSSNECAFTDWQAQGYQDGAVGASTSKFSDYNRVCADHGITADFGEWQAGRELGLQEYCQPGRAFVLGERGRNYYGVCSAYREAEFLEAYRIGSQLFTLRANYNRANNRLNNNFNNIDQIEKSLVDKGARLLLADTSAVEKANLLTDLKQLTERKYALEQEVDRLVFERDEAEFALRDYEATLITLGY